MKKIKGLDLNPLAVISARANYILAIADLILATGDDIELPVYLADSINMPVEDNVAGALPILRFSLDTEQGTFDLSVPTVFIQHGTLGPLLRICDEEIERGASVDQFLERIATNRKSRPRWTLW